VEAINKKPSIPWNKELSIKFVGDIWALAYYALIDAGKNDKLLQMQDSLKANQEPKEVLNIIQRFVDIEGVRSKIPRKRR
jgi:hypothetical protein